MKRFLSVMLAVCLLLSSANCSIFAADGVEAAAEEGAEGTNETAETADEIDAAAYSVETSALKIYTDSQIYINPLYEDVIDESDLVQPSDSASVDTTSTTGTVEYFSSISEAAVSVREGMEARQGTIRIGFTNQTGYSASIFKEIFAEAIEHTGVSTQGDYLKWQYAGYHVSASSKYSGGWYNITYTVTFT